jgi:hypothetical protein
MPDGQETPEAPATLSWPYRYWLTYDELMAIGVPILTEMPWLRGAHFDPERGRLYVPHEVANQTAMACFELTHRCHALIQLHGEPI